MGLPHSWPCLAGTLSVLFPASYQTVANIPCSHSSLAISIGSTLLTNSLTHFVRLLTPSLQSSAVLRAGALNLHSLTRSSVVLTSLRQCYAKSFDRIMIFALVLTCLGMPVACGMRWFNIKAVAADREKQRAQLESKPEICVGSKGEVPALADTSTPPVVK